MPKGRKVFRSREMYKKKRAGRLIIAVLIIIALLVVVFLAYSVGGPVFEFLKENNESETEAWVPEITSVSEETSVSSDTETTLAVNEKDTASVTLEDGSLADISTLDKALENISSEGYSSVIVNLKSSGGTFNYITESDFAYTDINLKINGTLTAKQIADAIREKGLEPIAKISVLADNNRYGEFRDGSYKIAEDNSTWLDNAPQKGGKPWLSPFEKDTKDYYTYLVNEISSAGFSAIICDDIIFPQFRNSDLRYIGSSVTDAVRYKALIELYNVMVSASGEKSKIIIETDAENILMNKSEIFKPSELDKACIAVNFSVDKLPDSIESENVNLSTLSPEDKIIKSLEIIKDESKELEIIPYINMSLFSTEQREILQEKLKADGYNTFFMY